MKKAVEALKVASQTTGEQFSSPSLLKSMLHIQDQIQAATPDSLPLILEGGTAFDHTVVKAFLEMPRVVT